MKWFKYLWMVVFGIIYLFGWRYVIDDILESIRTSKEKNEAFFHHLKPFTYCWISTHITAICIISLAMYIFGQD